MSNIKKDTIAFSVEGVELIDELSDSQFATADIEAFSSGDNLHDLVCSVDTLRKTAHTIYEKPVIFELDPNFYDFGTHNEGVTVPAGFVVPGSAEFIERDDGRTTLKVIAKIWKKYAQDFMRIFELSEDKNKSVSVEIEIYDKKEDSESGVSEMLAFAYAAITVIGDFFTPASPDANIQLTSFTKDDLDAEKKEYQMVYRKEFSRYHSLDFSIPDKVKLNSQDGLEMASDDYEGTATSVILANYIVSKEKASPEKVRQIAKYFGRKNVSKPVSEEGDSWIAWQLYGGEDGMSWSKSLSDDMDIIDEEIMTYFDGGDDVNDRNTNNKESNMAKDVVEENVAEEEVLEPVDAEFEVGEESDEDVSMEEEAAESKDEDDEEDMKFEESEDDEEEDGSDDEDASFSMTARNINVQLQSALEDEKDSSGYSKYWVETHDDEYAYVYSYETGKTYRMKYEATENRVSLEISEAEEVVYEPMLVETAEARKVEFAELREFKQDILSKQFEFEVNSVLTDVGRVLDDNAISQAREESKGYTLDTIDAWKNAVKARAFAVSKELPEEKDDGVLRMETIFSAGGKSHLWG